MPLIRSSSGAFGVLALALALALGVGLALFLQSNPGLLLNPQEKQASSTPAAADSHSLPPVPAPPVAPEDVREEARGEGREVELPAAPAPSQEQPLPEEPAQEPVPRSLRIVELRNAEIDSNAIDLGNERRLFLRFALGEPCLEGECSIDFSIGNAVVFSQAAIPGSPDHLDRTSNFLVPNALLFLETGEHEAILKMRRGSSIETASFKVSLENPAHPSTLKDSQSACSVGRESFAGVVEEHGSKIGVSLNDFDAYAARIKWVCNNYLKRVSELLREGEVFHAGFTFAYNDSNNLARTYGDVVELNLYYYRSAAFEDGVIVHELAHVVQGYLGEQPLWMVEGVADYARLNLRPQDSPRLSRANCSYGVHFSETSYGCIADFFARAEGASTCKDFVVKLHKCLKARQCFDGTGIFRECGFESPEAAWEKFGPQPDK